MLQLIVLDTRFQCTPPFGLVRVLASEIGRINARWQAVQIGRMTEIEERVFR
jgi:hypothetical protein